MKPTLYLISNSPGEVSTFVKPVVSELRRKHPDWELQICLVPCPYATGVEARVIAEWPEAPQVWTPWQSARPPACRHTIHDFVEASHGEQQRCQKHKPCHHK